MKHRLGSEGQAQTKENGNKRECVSLSAFVSISNLEGS